MYEQGTKYHSLCGVSSGALISAFLAQYPLGREREAYVSLEKLFSSVENSDVWQYWYPILRFLGIKKPGFLDASPLVQLIQNNFSRQRVLEARRTFRIGVTSLTSGEYHVFDETHPDIAKFLYATAAYPVAFPPIRIGDDYWTDGCVRSVTPVRAAIDAGATHIDVILVSPKRSAHTFQKEPNALEVGLRAIDIMSNQLIDHDLKRAQLINKLVQAGVEKEKRYIHFRIIRTKEPLVKNALHFSPKDAIRLQKLGYRDAKELITLTP